MEKTIFDKVKQGVIIFTEMVVAMMISYAIAVAIITGLIF